MTQIPFILSRLTDEQLKLAILRPDDDVPPDAFTVSTKGDNVRIGVALGMEFHFPRGVALQMGRAADGSVNIHIIPSDVSQYALGQVVRDPELRYIGFRLVQIPKSKIEFLCDPSKIPEFRKRHAEKAIFTRAGKFLLAVAP